MVKRALLIRNHLGLVAVYSIQNIHLLFFVLELVFNGQASARARPFIPAEWPWMLLESILIRSPFSSFVKMPVYKLKVRFRLTVPVWIGGLPVHHLPVQHVTTQQRWWLNVYIHDLCILDYACLLREYIASKTCRWLYVNYWTPTENISAFTDLAAKRNRHPRNLTIWCHLSAIGGTTLFGQPKPWDGSLPYEGLGT